MPETFDAVVVGGGPAGSTTALLLARAGWSVLLLERKAFPRRKVCGEYISATTLPLLRRLGVAEAFLERAGPPARRVGLFAGQAVLGAELPRAEGDWGRAVGREHLDALLLEAAARAGAEVRQPWSATQLVRVGDLFHGRAEGHAGVGKLEFTARAVVAAHGSWESGPLPSQPAKAPPAPGDLFAFKAHFRDSALPGGLMPLLCFPGGYGGMAHSDGGRVSLSVCIRRDYLARLRRGGHSAGEDVGDYIRESCRGVREALAGARLDGAWLGAGPIRPGTRLNQSAGIFPVGNAAGEAHPAIAEGISMAMQSGWLLTGWLGQWRAGGSQPPDLLAVGRAYARSWRRHFGPRLRASSVIAFLASRPNSVPGVLRVLRTFPGLLSWAARWSGKTTCVVPALDLPRPAANVRDDSGL